MAGTGDATTAFARALVDEWARAGVTEAVIAPGSRSTPLVLAVAADPRIAVHVFLDERSAAAYALGIGKVSGRPAILACTSGTAAALFLPAVLEAFYSRVPLLVCTADRPPELQGVGAGQTIDQVGLYGKAVRGEFYPLPPEDLPGAPEQWRDMAAQAFLAATGSPAGPVHLNLAFREPLVPTGAPVVSALGRPDGAPWRSAGPIPPADYLAPAARMAKSDLNKAVLVLGPGANVSPRVAAQFCAATGAVFLADPLSNGRGVGAISTYDALLRSDEFASRVQPSGVIQVGAPLTSKVANAWLARVAGEGAPVWLIDPDGIWADPSQMATERVAANGEEFLTAVIDKISPVPRDKSRAKEWSETWSQAESGARKAIDQICSEWSDPFEGRIARDVVAALPAATTFFVASSMPVRDVDSFSAPRPDVRMLGNRGVNGIDGFVSTVLGGAQVADGPVVALLGDLCFLHDSNGLIGASTRGINATLVVVDNDGGGIFSFLPPAQALPASDFETLFSTPTGVDIVDLCAVHGIVAERVTEAAELTDTLGRAVATPGVSVIVVRVDRTTNVARHQAVWEAVAAATKI